MDTTENNFTRAQLQWAREHDWFISGDQTKIICENRYTFNHSEQTEFTDFKTLREWAGY